MSRRNFAILLLFIALIPNILFKVLESKAGQIENAASKKDLKEVVLGYQEADNEIKQSVKELDNKKVDKDVFELVLDGIKDIKSEQQEQRKLLMNRR